MNRALRLLIQILYFVTETLKVYFHFDPKKIHFIFTNGQDFDFDDDTCTLLFAQTIEYNLKLNFKFILKLMTDNFYPVAKIYKSNVCI